MRKLYDDEDTPKLYRELFFNNVDSTRKITTNAECDDSIATLEQAIIGA